MIASYFIAYRYVFVILPYCVPVIMWLFTQSV